MGPRTKIRADFEIIACELVSDELVELSDLDESGTLERDRLAYLIGRTHNLCMDLGIKYADVDKPKEREKAEYAAHRLLNMGYRASDFEDRPLSYFEDNPISKIA